MMYCLNSNSRSLTYPTCCPSEHISLAPLPASLAIAFVSAVNLCYYSAIFLILPCLRYAIKFADNSYF
jgi:hypothetical protein